MRQRQGCAALRGAEKGPVWPCDGLWCRTGVVAQWRTVRRSDGCTWLLVTVRSDSGSGAPLLTCESAGVTIRGSISVSLRDLLWITETTPKSSLRHSSQVRGGVSDPLSNGIVTPVHLCVAQATRKGPQARPRPLSRCARSATRLPLLCPRCSPGRQRARSPGHARIEDAHSRSASHCASRTSP